MNDPEKKPRHLWLAAAAHYVSLAPTLRAVARSHGYALGVHGSLTTDMDLIAAPWVDDASSAEDLVEALRECVGGEFRRMPPCESCRSLGRPTCPHVDPLGPTIRPHGRRAWSIHFVGGSGPYLDVSVMPLSLSALPRKTYA